MWAQQPCPLCPNAKRPLEDGGGHQSQACHHPGLLVSLLSPRLSPPSILSHPRPVTAQSSTLGPNLTGLPKQPNLAHANPFTRNNLHDSDLFEDYTTH